MTHEIGQTSGNIQNAVASNGKQLQPGPQIVQGREHRQGAAGRFLEKPTGQIAQASQWGLKEEN
jgi:hypothetical protein